LRRYPKVAVQLREDVTAELVSALHQGKLEIALVALPIEDASLESVALWSEPLQVALPRGHRLAKQKTIRLAELEDEPFILLSDMHCLSDQVVSYCQSKFVPKIACRCVQLITIQQMIGLGLGVSLLPERACQPASHKQIVYRSLAAPGPTRSVGAVWHRHHHLSPNVKALLEMTGTWAEA
jgi:LysR family hydrogen peroxide-inducible transcriptional activator